MRVYHRHGFGVDVLSLKTATYGIMHLVVAILVAYALTLDWRKALAIGIVEPFVQTIAFTLHDRYWRAREHSASGVSGARRRGLFGAAPAVDPATA
jgi:uncharacterized membrane protein